jgi:hypothetical protein
MSTKRRILVLAGFAALALVFSTRAFAAVTVAQPNVGAAKMSVQTTNSSECLQDFLQSNTICSGNPQTCNTVATGVEAWDIAAGGTYQVTLTDVDSACISSGQTQVIVLNSNTGNTCKQATCAGTICTFDFDLNEAPNVVDGTAGACHTSPVKYCTSNCSPSTGQFAQRSDGLTTQAGGRQESHLRASDFSNPSDPPSCGTAAEDEDCSPAQHGCSNTPGAQCCTLTQGCLGAWNSICNCTGPSCNAATAGTGYLSGAPGSSCLPATVGGPGNTVTVANQLTLISELPAGGSPGPLSGTYAFSVPKSQPDWSGQPSDPNLGGTGGQGGGSLTGQAFSTTIADCLGSSGAFAVTSTGLGGFVLPTTGTLLCTQRSGEDKHLETGDDNVCQAFAFPACLSGKTIAEALACANEQLGTGSNSCGCGKSELGAAMGDINGAFDNCATVIACPTTTAGEFDCSSGAPVASVSGSCGTGDAADVASCRSNSDSACAGIGAPYPTHGAYVSCVGAQTRTTIALNALRSSCKGKVIKCAAKSTFNTSRVTCCRGSKCSIKSSASQCTDAGGTLGSSASCCDACP